MLYPFIILSLALLWFAIKIKFIVVSIASAATWLALGTYLFIYIDPPLDITEMSSQFLMGALFLMAFVPLLLQFTTDVTTEKRARGIKGPGGILGDRAESSTARKWGSGKSTPTALSRQSSYKEGLKNRRR